ncbi:MAG: 3-deoxy-D-manno-octulosonic acid kinase [Gammaproteobacteria bacterium]
MGKHTESAGCYILHDENTIDNLEARHFDPAYWHDRPDFGRIHGGRGGSIEIVLAGRPAILRRYLRGGMVAPWVSDLYLWTGKSRTRPWREWEITRLALTAGLPVPEPLGIYVQRNGLLYRAAIITALIEDTETLAKRLSHSLLDENAWYQLGSLIRRLHAHGICHPDVNTTNLLINPQGQFYIIDFDRARLMKKQGDWQWGPLSRLQRSLKKIGRQQELYYQESDWQALMDGYQKSN